jgi:hypothetical protein
LPGISVKAVFHKKTFMLKVNLASVEGFSPEQSQKLEIAKAKLENALNSEKFKTSVLDFTFDSEKTFYYRKNLFGRYVDKPYSNTQVYDIILNGTELPGNIALNQMDLYLVLLPSINPTVVGYGNPGSREIYTYRNWFEKFTEAEYAAHITHEWCHKLGFDHSHNHTRKRKYSVPYAIGDLVEELIEHI